MLIFLAACLAIVPLAGWLGRATEQLAHNTNEGIGGLLNATFGNATELIIPRMSRKDIAWDRQNMRWETNPIASVKATGKA